MNTYTKFLVKTYLLSILYIFFIFFCLIYVLNLLTELEFFKQTNVTSYFPLYLSLINTPIFVFEMFPFIFLISTQFFFNNLFTDNEINIFKYSGLKNTKIFSILTITTFFVGIIIISIFYNLSSNLKNLYLGLKSNYTEDKKYLAVITNNGLWIKDIDNGNIKIINASKIDGNTLNDVFISEFDQNYNLTRNIISKKVDVSRKNWILLDAKIYEKNSSKKIEKSIMSPMISNSNNLVSVLANKSPVTVFSTRSSLLNSLILGSLFNCINSIMYHLFCLHWLLLLC